MVLPVRLCECRSGDNLSVFWFGGLGARLFGAAPHIVPHNFMDLSILLLVISIASNTQTLIHREDSKALPSGKA
jgi:hypothetical protein